MKKILINCDDLGMHPTINNGILSVLDKGVVKSASLLPTGQYFEEAILGLKKIGVSKIGVHLSLCAEYPKAPLMPVLSRSQPFLSLEEWLQTPRDLHLCQNEIIAQIEKVEKTGLQISHLDGHMFFYEPAVGGKKLFELVQNIADRIKIPLRHQEGNQKRVSPSIRMIWDDYDTLESRFSFYENLFREDACDFLELIIHPGTPAEEMKKFTNKPERRYADFLFFTDPKLRHNLRDLGWSAVGRSE